MRKVRFYLCPKDVSFSLLPFSSPPLDYKVYKARIHIYFFETNEIDRIYHRIFLERKVSRRDFHEKGTLRGYH